MRLEVPGVTGLWVTIAVLALLWSTISPSRNLHYKASDVPAWRLWGHQGIQY